MTYTYNNDQPPLMRDNPSILNVPWAALRSKTVSSSKQPNSPETNTDSQHDHWQTYNSFLINRYQVWRITAAPHHYNSDTTDTHTVMNGYDETKMTELVKSLSATIGASGCGLSASVTADISLTTQDTQTWTASTEDSTKVKYNANTTYIGWTLYDHIEAVAQLWYQYEYKGAKPPGFTKRGGPTTSVLEIVMKNYDDVIDDPAANFVPSTRALLAHTGGCL